MVYILAAGSVFVFTELLSYILSKLFNIAFPSFSNWFLRKKRDEFFDTLKDKSFRKFKTDVLEKYYSDLKLARINNRTFPVYLFPYYGSDCEKVDEYRGDRWIRKYDTIINREESDEFRIDLAEHQMYKHLNRQHGIPFTSITQELFCTQFFLFFLCISQDHLIFNGSPFIIVYVVKIHLPILFE